MNAMRPVDAISRDVLPDLVSLGLQEGCGKAWRWS